MRIDVGYALMALNVPSSELGVDPLIRQSVFLQTWKTSIGHASLAPKGIRDLLSSAAQYGVRLEGIAFAHEVQLQMPIWHHKYADARIRRLTHAATSVCLINKHSALSVRDAVRTTDVLFDPRHIPHDECECDTCEWMCDTFECQTPHSCALRATDLLDCLPPKWDPRHDMEDSLRPLDQIDSDDADEGWINIEPRILVEDDIAHAFRVFGVTGSDPCAQPPLGARCRESAVICIGTDGSCLRNGDADACAGAGGFIATDHEDNFATRVPANVLQSNQTGEMLAVKIACESLDPTCRLDIISDSKWVIDELTSLLNKHEDEGYVNCSNGELTRATVARIRERSAPTRIRWEKGHAGHLLNEGADALAGEGARDATWLDEEATTPELGTAVQGVRLTSLTQSIAYRAIRSAKMVEYTARPRTVHQMDMTVAAFEENFERKPTTAAIFKSLRSKEFPKKIRTFLWMVAHDAFMVGSHWLRDSYKQEIRDRAECRYNGCGGLEDLQHIFSYCEAPGQALVWQLAKELWTRRRPDWPFHSMGAILSSGLAEFKSDEGKRRPGDARLYRILMGEAAQLIWALRCERTISKGNEPHTEDAIRCFWTSRINDRLRKDCLAANFELKAGRKALPKSRVLATWAGLLQNESNLPRDWTRSTGVLVGIELG
jgi:ribonuclease HI